MTKKIYRPLQPNESAVMKSMLDLRRKRQAIMAKNRKKIKNRTGAIKYPNELVAKVRGQWLASTGLKNISAMQVAALNSIPISTVRKMLYTPGYRPHADAQVQPHDSALYKAQMQAIQDQYDLYAKQENQDRQSSKDAGKFTTADRKKMLEASSTPATKVDYNSMTPMQQIISDNNKFTSWDQIIYAVQQWMRTNGKTCPSILGQLVTQISRSTGVTS